MRTRTLVATGAAVALLAVPAAAPATGPPAEPGAGHGSAQGQAKRSDAPGPDASRATKARAYGKYCKNESKKHVDGEKGTAFSRCVTAMARLGSGKASNPARACRGLSKKHVEGKKGTAYSRCVRAAAKLRRDKRRSDPSRYADPFDQ